MSSSPTNPADRRINARLDPDRKAKLELLREATGESVTDLVKAGIDLLWERQQRRSRRSALRVLRDAGFIGAGEGAEDLSESYKEHLAAGLAEKYGHR